LLLIIAFASGLSTTPYSFADGYALCMRHERMGSVTEENWTSAAIVWDHGFEYCHDFMGWWAESKPDQDKQDKLMIDEMQRALGPYPWPVHAK
jgi:hypothetical protein